MKAGLSDSPNESRAMPLLMVIEFGVGAACCKTCIGATVTGTGSGTRLLASEASLTFGLEKRFSVTLLSARYRLLSRLFCLDKDNHTIDDAAIVTWMSA